MAAEVTAAQSEGWKAGLGSGLQSEPCGVAYTRDKWLGDGKVVGD